MATIAKPSPEITRAAEHYLEQYGDPLVMNTYLKITILVLAVVCLCACRPAVSGARRRSPVFTRSSCESTTSAVRKRSTIATSNTGLRKRRTSITCRAGPSSISPQPLHHRTRPDQRALLPEWRRATRCDRPGTQKQRHSDLRQGQLRFPLSMSRSKTSVLDDLRQSPYSARIEFEKVFTNSADQTELKRERWTATVTYVFRENVKNNELAVNPLGLTIVRFRADQAFE